MTQMQDYNRAETIRTFSRIGWAYMAMLACSQAGAMLLSLGVQALARGGSEAMISFMQSGWYVWLLTDIATYGMGLPVLLLIIHRVPTQSGLSRKRVTPKQFGGLVLVCYAAAYLLNLVGLGLTALISLVKGSPVNNILQSAVNSSDPRLTFLFGVLIAPALEEYVFRGILLDKLRGYGEGLCIFASGLFFGLFHANLNQLPYAFALGAIFAYVVLRTGTILWSVLLHMIVNFFGITVTSAVAATGSQIWMALLGFAVIAILVSGILIFIRRCRRIHLNGGPAPYSEREKRGMLLKSGGVVCFMGLSLMLILITIIFY